MKHQQKGFAVLETLLIVIILAIIGGTGYFVWHSRQNTDKTLGNAAKSQPGIPKTKNEPQISTTGWASFTSKLEGFAIRYPKDWEVVSNGELSTNPHNGSRSEYLSIMSGAEKLSSGRQVRAELTVDVATSGLSGGDCSGLGVYDVTDLAMNQGTLHIVSLESHADKTKIINIRMTDELGLKPGSLTSTCMPSFTSKKGNSNVFIEAGFLLPHKAGDQSIGSSTELTYDEYNHSELVRQVQKILTTLAY